MSNPSRTIHRRTDPTKSMDSQSAAPSHSLSTHFSKLGIVRRSLRARSPPPHVVLQSDFSGTKNPLSKSAIFEGKGKPFSQTTKRVVKETKRAGLEKDVAFSVVKEKPMLRLGRSRSLCDPKVELASFLVINGVKLVNADMPPFMQIHAVGCARKTCDSLEKFSSRALALSLKKEFDGAYGPAWHCIVGTSFGSFVTHSVGGFLYFSMDQKLHILLFKTTVERAK